MSIKKDFERIKYIDQLIRNQTTGTPNELAEKLNISPRHLYNILHDLADLGAKIIYDKNNQSYKYLNEIDFLKDYFNIK